MTEVILSTFDYDKQNLLCYINYYRLLRNILTFHGVSTLYDNLLPKQSLDTQNSTHDNNRLFDESVEYDWREFSERTTSTTDQPLLFRTNIRGDPVLCPMSRYHNPTVNSVD